MAQRNRQGAVEEAEAETSDPAYSADAHGLDVEGAWTHCDADGELGENVATA